MNGSNFIDEIITGFCENVIFYAPFTDNRQGILGNLYCTDFRLAFVPLINIASNDKVGFVCQLFSSLQKICVLGCHNQTKLTFGR